jgi:hypothetical protein
MSTGRGHFAYRIGGFRLWRRAAALRYDPAACAGTGTVRARTGKRHPGRHFLYTRLRQRDMRDALTDVGP